MSCLLGTADEQGGAASWQQSCLTWTKNCCFAFVETAGIGRLQALEGYNGSVGRKN